MSLPEGILAKLSISEIGKHLSNYMDLFIRPVNVWRTIITSRTRSYNLTILHVVYYSLFILLFLGKPFTDSIAYVLLELLVTIIPFLIFFIPFALYSRVFRKQIKWNRMFRLCVILKLQFLPPMVLLILLARWAHIEGPYTILENLIWLLWLTLILVLPLILALKGWQKALWITTNLAFFILFLLAFSLITERFRDLNALIEKVRLSTPNLEFLTFQIESSHSEVYILDDYYLMIVKRPTSDSLELVNTQFVTAELLYRFKLTQINRRNIRLKRADSLRKLRDTTKIGQKMTWIDSLKIYPKENELSMQTLDSLREKFDKMIIHDLELTERLKDSAIFQSNRRYFSALHNYYLEYQKPHYDLHLFYKIKTKDPIETIDLENRNIAIMYRIDSAYIKDAKSRYKEIQEELEKRTMRSNLVFIPVDFVLERIGYYD